MSEIKKVVLAYSGGLDTSIIIPWLKENYNNPEIIAVSADVGQGDELDGLEEKAIKTGASKLYIEDLTDEMVDEVIIPSMMMGAKYEDYLLGTAFARPIIGKRLVEIAKKEGADAICHGCTGKGNDQVRFELAIKRFAPEMKIIAPWREWDTGLTLRQLAAAMVDAVRPAALICVDSLCSAEAARLGRTIQFSDTGLHPADARHARHLDAAALGVPVIAAGIPTLMDADEGADLVLTPRALDSVIAHGSALLAGILNRALQPRLSVAQLCWLTG